MTLGIAIPHLVTIGLGVVVTDTAQSRVGVTLVTVTVTHTPGDNGTYSHKMVMFVTLQLRKYFFLFKTVSMAITKLIINCG